MPDDSDATYATGELDLLYARGALWFALGPNAVADADLVDAFERIAAWGPQNRVGLLPSRSTRRWRVADQPGNTLLLPPCPVACTGIEHVVASAVQVRPDVPIAAWRCGDYLCIYCDHGLGDGSYVARLVAALTNPAALANFDPANVRVTRHPFALALWTGVRSQPRQLVRDVAHSGHGLGARLRASLRTNRSRPAANQTSATAGSEPTAEEVSTVWVSSGPTYLKDLRAYRDTAHPGISTTVLVMFAICTSLRSVCGAMSEDVELLVDMRRFLPPGSTTFGNFASVVNVPLSPRDTPEALGMALNSRVNSYRALFRLLSLAALSKVRYSWPRERSRPGWSARQGRPGDGRTKTTFIDWSKFPPNAHIGWSDIGRAELAVVTPPATREHLVLVVTSPGDDRVQVTARFYESHIASDDVRAALMEALDAAP